MKAELTKHEATSIEAVQFCVDTLQFAEGVVRWIVRSGGDAFPYRSVQNRHFICVKTISGRWEKAGHTDWIIRGPDGWCVCCADVFKVMYNALGNLP